MNNVFFFSFFPLCSFPFTLVVGSSCVRSCSFSTFLSLTDTHAPFRPSLSVALFLLCDLGGLHGEGSVSSRQMNTHNDFVTQSTHSRLGNVPARHRRSVLGTEGKQGMGAGEETKFKSKLAAPQRVTAATQAPHALGRGPPSDSTTRGRARGQVGRPLAVRAWSRILNPPPT